MAVAIAVGALVALEGGLVGPIEDEERLDCVPQEAHESVEERADCWVGTAPRGEDLELPDGDVDCESQGAAGGFEVGGGEGSEGDALPGPDFFVDATVGSKVGLLVRDQCIYCSCMAAG